MPRTLLFCFTIVAAFQPQPALAAPVSEDVLLPASITAIARMLGLDPARDRARFLSEFTRLLYTPPQGKQPAIEAAVQAAARRGFNGSGDVRHIIPVPLPVAVWSQAVFHRTVAADRLVAEIVADRRAALLAYGLTGLDDETLAYLAREPAVLSQLHQESAPVFAAFGASLRIEADRIVPPGGVEAVPLWESVVGERVGQPDRFVRALFGLEGGRVAYLYDLIAQLDPPHAAFALGTWMVDQGVRRARFEALAAAGARAYPEWRQDELPFSKPMNDLTFLLVRMRVAPSGAPEPPATRTFWTAAFATDDPLAPAPEWPPDAAGELVDAAWLAQALSLDDAHGRGDRLDQLAFAQRVFKNVGREERDGALAAVRSLRRQRMLMLTFERMGVTSPAVYASAGHQVSRIALRDPSRAFWTLSQLQGALALVARAAMTGGVDHASAEALVASLCAVPVGPGGRYAGALAEWVERELLPRLPAGGDAEARIIAALAGVATGPPNRVSWEGHVYRVDLASAESRRLVAVRAKQQSDTVDFALALHRMARWLAADDITAAGLRTVTEELASVSDEFASVIRRPEPNILPRGVQPPRRAAERMEAVAKSLASVAAGRDLRRAARVGAQLSEFVDFALGEALLSLVYAVNLGDPDGTALLPRNVALRHDFGLTSPDADSRERLPWALPRQEFQPGVPWHVTGSLLGMDVALAPLALRHANVDLIGEAPRLPSNEREAFSVSAVLMNPRRLADKDRDAIADAVTSGRRRVAWLADGRENFDAMADELQLDGRRRRTIRWTLVHESAGVASLFSMVELLTLGGGAPGADLDAWGMSALASWSCPCTRLLSPHYWGLFAGRPQLGLMTPAMPDLNLHVAVLLRELGVPAILAPSVLAAAAQDFVHNVAPTDPNDWWTLARTAPTVSRQRIEDYVAAAAETGGPLVPDVSGSDARR